MRHRQATPAAVWWNLTARSSMTYGLFRWLRELLFFCMGSHRLRGLIGREEGIWSWHGAQ